MAHRCPSFPFVVTHGILFGAGQIDDGSVQEKTRLIPANRRISMDREVLRGNGCWKAGLEMLCCSIKPSELVLPKKIAVMSARNKPLAVSHGAIAGKTFWEVVLEQGGR
jgi:hypothetical protein